MKLSLALILYELRKAPDPPVIVSEGLFSENVPVSTISFLSGDSPSGGILYIAEQGELHRDAVLPAPLLVAGIPAAEHVAGPAYVDLPLRELVNRVSWIFNEYDLIEGELNSAVARSEPLRTVLSICARFFNNPVTLSDLRMRFIETSDNLTAETAPPYLKVVLDTGYIDIRIMQAMKKKGFDVQVNSTSETLLFELDEIPARWFSKNIYEGHQIIAGFVVHEVFCPLDFSQSVLIDQLAQTIDNYVFKSPRGKQTSKPHLEQIVSELLDGGQYIPDIHGHYLKRMNWSDESGYMLIKLQVSAENYSMSTAQFTFDAAHNLFPASLIIERDDSAVIVVCDAQLRYDFKEAMTRLEKYLEERHDRAAVSRRFQGFAGIRDHYKAISLALKLGEAIDPSKTLYYFEEYSIPVMLRLSSRKLDLRVFCMNEALRLHELDMESGSEFFRSLYAYLMHGRSLAAAAGELKIHRNTLLYRLRRVSEITGLDLSDDRIVFPMLLSYQILHYRLKIEELPMG